MKNTTLMQEMVAIAGILKGSKLKDISKIETSLESIRCQAKLETHEEVIVLTAILDRQCSDNQSSINELSNYFQSTTMEVMMMAPAIKSLISKGYIKSNNSQETDIKKMNLEICLDIFNSIIEGRDINPIPPENREFDNISFCKKVHEMISERENGKISTRELFTLVERLENEHENMTIVSELKNLEDDVTARTFLYEMCNDFVRKSEGGATSLNSTLNDIYDNFTEGAFVKKNILNESHPLINKDLISIQNINDNDDNDDNDTILNLSDISIRILLGDVAEAFIKDYSCSDKYEFLKKVADLVREIPYDAKQRDYKKFELEVDKLEKACQNLSTIVNVMKVINDFKVRILYHRLCCKFINSSVFHIEDLQEIYNIKEVITIKVELKAKQHFLQRLGLIEIKNDNFLERSEIMFTDKGNELFLEEDINLFEEGLTDDDIIISTKIAKKQLFFEPSLEKQLFMLKNSLEEQNLNALRDRLKASNLPSGIAVLLYGQPGTGKTESVLQIARETNRAVMHVDISDTKSCWFGESEKIIKKVFTKYRRLCKKSKIKPILLFNEADAVLSKRKDSNSSNVAQTENAIQNIILEEIESLDGILIATTNLVTNLDKAFERRFLFKIHFDKPSLDSKKNIWKNKLPYLNDKETHTLASSFDFSGGEIDNIVRKATISEVISGDKPNLECLITLCKQERITSSNKKIGF